MNNREFIDTIYTPYSECWTIMKTIQHSKSSDDDKAWEAWDKATKEFDAKYDNPIGHILSKMLYSLGDEIGKINERTH